MHIPTKPSKIIGDAPCPRCRENGRDKTGNHLILFENGAKYCNRCKYYVTTSGDEEINYKEDMNKDNESIHLSHAEIATLFADDIRDIPKAFIDVYGIKVEYDPTTREQYKHYYPVYRKGESSVYCYHTRLLPKTFGFTKKVTGEDLTFFGSILYKGFNKRLLLTEGYLDAVAANYMLAKYNVPCVSFPNGANIHYAKINFDFLSQFDELYLHADNDKAGKELIQQMQVLFPNIKVLTTSEKDACAMLHAGKQAEFVNAFWSAKKYRPPIIITVEDVLEESLKDPEYGRPWPWPSLNKLTYGRRDGEGMYLGAGVKAGKSEWINQLAAHIITAENNPVAVVKYEERPAQTVKRLAGKIDKTFYHKPDVVYDKEKLRSTIQSFKEKLFMYQAFQSADWDTLKTYIRYVVSEGVKDIIIDPVTKLTNHLSSSDTETELRRISDEIACMAQDLKFFYIITCHLKAPLTGKPHEKGGAIESNQFRGSRAMMENCHLLGGIRRNKDPELPEDERNTSELVLLEERNYGNVGKFKIFYNKETQEYLEPTILNMGI